MTTPNAAQIAAQNDLFRRTLIGGPVRGQTVLTRGVATLPPVAVAAVLGAVATFTAFTKDNDPYGEHDCAVITVAGERFIWKIDYYADASLTYGAEDPRTAYRVLTIMLASDY